ncbi:MAG: stage II sporulation protein M [Actinobacteria bacterium]|nr:stage II sporulation protein M [Actinomycetota bacterium]MCG2799867.1 stage II sporulation protein M [Cellulomonas sp.]
MDLDAFAAVHAPQWDRLDRLSRRRRLSGAEVDELVRLYRSVATDLSTVRSAAPDPLTVMRLSQLVGRAHARLAGTHVPAWEQAGRFLRVSFPAALYRIRWWTVAVMVAFLVVAVATGWHLAVHDDLRNAVMSPADQQQYVDSMFAQYYDPGAGFAAMVWTNNAWIAAVCVASGITGVGPVLMLAQNAVGVGEVGAVMAVHGELGLFFQLISPHGLLELTAIFVAGAAGLRIFWAWIAPGPRPRSRALAEEGRALFTVALGLVLVLAVSGLIEGFVTGSTLPWPVKTTIGAVALAGFWAYTLVLGGRAAALGETGDLAPDRAGYAVATAG